MTADDYSEDSGYMRSHKCFGEGCNRRITYRFAICAECEKVYGTSPLGWPAWLRFLWNQEQRERRKNRTRRKMEINVDMELLNEIIGDDGEPTVFMAGDNDG